MTAYPQHPSSEKGFLPSGALPSNRENSHAAQNSSPATVRGRVLIVAYHFPPQAGSSGLLRSLKFCRYLPEFGWLPTVLTIDPRAYERTDSSQMAEIPADVNVIRAFGLDSQRHLSLGGRYLRSSALPDRWVTWLAGAIPAGLFSIRKHNIDIILTTYPIATAVLIGYFLHLLSGKPWIVDFRDSMTEEGYPAGSAYPAHLPVDRAQGDSTWIAVCFHRARYDSHVPRAISGISVQISACSCRMDMTKRISKAWSRGIPSDDRVRFYIPG